MGMCSVRECRFVGMLKAPSSRFSAGFGGWGVDYLLLLLLFLLLFGSGSLFACLCGDGESMLGAWRRFCCRMLEDDAAWTRVF